MNVRRPFPIWPTGFSNWPTRVPGPVSTGRYLDTIQICECQDCRSTVRVDLLYRHRVAPALCAGYADTAQLNLVVENVTKPHKQQLNLAAVSAYPTKFSTSRYVHVLTKFSTAVSVS